MEDSVTIYHNPRCSKSRQTLELIRGEGIEPQIIEYLKSPPDSDTLNELMQGLGCEPRALMRKRETPYLELELDAEELSRTELIEAMVANPILIERPIVVANGQVRVGRPPESVLEILP